MVPMETLKELACLKPLSEEQLDKIGRISTVKTYPKDAYVQKENDIAASLYFVTQGRVAIEIDLPKHRKIVIYIVSRGDLFSWSALVPPHLITAGSLCLEETTLVEVPREPLLQLFETDIALKASMMETVSHVIANRLKDTRLQLGYLLGWD